MRFKDLPSLEEILSYYDEVYCHDISYSYRYCYLLVHKTNDGGEKMVTAHNTLNSAHDYLRFNPEVEVLDDFFGNNFPFLKCLTLSMYMDNLNTGVVFSHKTAIVISLLSILRTTPMKHKHEFCDFDILNRGLYGFKNFEEFHDLILKQNKYLSTINTAYVASLTHDHLKERIDILKIMRM